LTFTASACTMPPLLEWTLSQSSGKSPFLATSVPPRLQHLASGGGGGMPLFMDVHQKLPEGATADDVAKAHAADVATQDKYGVNYKSYWVDEANGKVFCLVEAPD